MTYFPPRKNDALKLWFTVDALGPDEVLVLSAQEAIRRMLYDRIFPPQGYTLLWEGRWLPHDYLRDGPSTRRGEIRVTFVRPCAVYRCSGHEEPVRGMRFPTHLHLPKGKYPFDLPLCHEHGYYW